MATRFFTRSVLAPTKQTLTSVFSRSFTSLSLSNPPQSLSATSSTLSLFRLRPLAAIATSLRQNSVASSSIRCFSSRQTSSSLKDPQPNWSNRPPKETILLDGCDFEHWLVVMEKPDDALTRDEIIDGYIKTLAQVVGSEEEARMKIYSVSTRCYFAFGALVSEELSYKLKELPRVRWVLPDSYLDVKNKDYGGEPFINGQAVPYDPRYHAEWERNNARANDRNRRNDRPRNYDRSRNFDRRNMGQRGPPGPQSMGPNSTGNMQPNNTGDGAPNMPPPNNFSGMPSNNMGGQASSYMGQQPSNYMGGQPPSNHMGGMGGQPPSNMGGMGGQASNYMGQQPSNYMRGPPPPPNHMGGMQNNSGGVPNNAPNGGGTPYQSGPGLNQNNYAPNMAGGNTYQNHNVPGRDVPPPQNYQ